MFQQMWGGGVLLGMLLMGAVSAAFSLSKRNITLAGCAGTALGMVLLAFSAATTQQSLVTPALVIMGFFTGIFNVGALSMMMDMTIPWGDRVVYGAVGHGTGVWQWHSFHRGRCAAYRAD
ncbi:BCD family MFS transporter [bacterium]|nr:BCD family MFS transporter [bacterium]